MLGVNVNLLRGAKIRFALASTSPACIRCAAWCGIRNNRVNRISIMSNTLGLSAQWRAYAWYFASRLSRALLHSLRSAVIGPHPSPPPLRQGREHINSVTLYRISLPCRSGGGLGWGPMTAERRECSHFLSSTTRTSPICWTLSISSIHSAKTPEPSHAANSRWRGISQRQNKTPPVVLRRGGMSPRRGTARGANVRACAVVIR